MKITPLFDRVVIEPVDAEEKTKSGIVLLAKDQEKPQMAKIIAVGPGGIIDGKDVKMQVKVGDKVLYSKRIQTGRKGSYHSPSERYSGNC